MVAVFHDVQIILRLQIGRLTQKKMNGLKFRRENQPFTLHSEDRALSTNLNDERQDSQ